MVDLDIPSWALNAFEHLGDPLAIDPVTMGLINKTFIVTTARSKYILQEVSPIFDTTVTEDSLAVARHLETAGIASPKPYATQDGALFIKNAGRLFRALCYVNGKASHTIASATMAESAGVALGTFHRAMLDFDYDYRSKRRHGGDYPFHRDNLLAALAQHTGHDYYERVAPCAQTMLTAIENLTKNLVTTPRHVHGDPKVSNILFGAHDDAICLVDFDTLGKSGWSLEVADALRSWCNPFPEDMLDAHVDLARAEAALKGYGAIMRGIFTAKEASEMVIHTQAISLCLAMRYLTDVLNESYFQYDASRFARAAEHQWLKAQAMYSLFLDFSRKESAIATMATRLLVGSDAHASARCPR